MEHVHPADWPSPEPAPRYNLVVLGAGTAGLVTAAGAAGLGARVALVEHQLLGGDCLNVGCVPSKALIASARAIHDVRRAKSFGIDVPGEPRADFASIMERVRRLRADISPHDSAARFRDLGVDVYLGPGRFVARDAVEVGGRTLHFSRAVICTGGRPAVPDVPGLAEAGYLTNETIFTLTELPARLAVLGAGPIGCELAQAFARLGSRVLLVERGERILGREHAEAARRLTATFAGESIEIATRTRLASVRAPGRARTLTLEREGATSEREVEAILVAVGRRPNVEELDLERAGVELDSERGIVVDDALRTTNRRIFAAGDVAFRHKFTHVADALARIAIQNALFGFLPRKARASALTIPWCTYTDPEIAHVGLGADEAAERGIQIETLAVELEQVDRARLDGETAGFLEVRIERGGDRIVGATLVARHAGETISEITTAIVAGAGVGTIARVIHPYPTQAEAIKKAGDLYNRSRLTPFVSRVLGTLMRWQR